MKQNKPAILIVDDEARSLESLKRNLIEEFDVHTAQNTADASKILEDQWIQIILCDQRMPDMSGVDFLTEVREKWPDVIRMIISGYTDAEDIIAGLNDAGIYLYITKPWQPEDLVLKLRNAASLFELQRQNELLAIELHLSLNGAQKKVDERRKKLCEQYDFDDGIIRSKSSPMNAICNTLSQIAPFDLPVLFEGEPGTGKELVARAIHYNSLRWNKPFVVQNCGSMEHDLLEATLFGYKKGAVPSAVQDHAGLFERAYGGTIYLEEISDLPEVFQVKLLRVLQEGEFRPVGSNQTRKLDVRILAGTVKKLGWEVNEGRFRQDLYYYLAGVVIEIPSLSDRREDIPLLANYLLRQSIDKLGKQAAGFTSEVISCMKRYCWPGNIREMQNEIDRMLVMGTEDEYLGAKLLSQQVLMGVSPDDEDDVTILGGSSTTLKERVEVIEVKILREALIRHGWNKSKAARELGLSRVGLRSKLDRYGLEKIENVEDHIHIKTAG